MAKAPREAWFHRIYTANADLKETNYFEWNDPFAIVLEIRRTSNKSSAAYPMEILVQIDGLRADPEDVGPWKTPSGAPRLTLEFTHAPVALDEPSGDKWLWNDKKYWRKWSSFGELMSGVVNGTRGGVFALNATLRFLYFRAFDAGGPYHFHFPGEPKPALGGGGGGGGGGVGGGGGGGTTKRPGREPFDPKKTDTLMRRGRARAKTKKR